MSKVRTTKLRKRKTTPPYVLFVKRLVGRLLMIGLLFSVGFLGYRALAASSLLTIEEVKIETEGRLNKGDILELADIRAGTSLIAVRLFRLRDRVESHPWVSRASVKRIFPHTLVMNVVQKQPIAQVTLDRGVLLVDNDGTFFALSKPLKLTGLVPIVGLKDADIKLKPLVCQNRLKNALDAIRSVKARSGLQIKELKIDLENGITLALEESPKEVRLGLDDPDRSVGRLWKILEQLHEEGRLKQVRWIDLKSSNRAIVKFQG